jgi:hypothetical protein
MRSWALLVNVTYLPSAEMTGSVVNEAVFPPAAGRPTT